MSIEEQIQNKIQDFKTEFLKLNPTNYYSFASFSIDCNDLLSSTRYDIDTLIVNQEKSVGRISVETYLKLIEPCNECRDYLQLYIDRHIQNGIFD